MSSLKDNEANKFRIGKDGKPAIGITVEQSDPIPVQTAGVEWDEIITTFPTTNQDLFTYKRNTNIVQTVLVTYESSSKKTILHVLKTRF
jgi:hypothetical protein